MNTYIVLLRHAWPSGRELEAAAARSNDADELLAGDVCAVRRYVLAEEDGSLGSICVYRATSEDKVREHAACAGIPAHEVISVSETRPQ